MHPPPAGAEHIVFEAGGLSANSPTGNVFAIVNEGMPHSAMESSSPVIAPITQGEKDAHDADNPDEREAESGRGFKVFMNKVCSKIVVKSAVFVKVWRENGILRFIFEFLCEFGCNECMTFVLVESVRRLFVRCSRFKLFYEVCSSNEI